MRYVIYPILLLIVACSGQTGDAGGQSSDQQFVREIISVQNFKKKLTSAANHQLIDVRTAEEFEGGHIEGAVNIDYYDPEFEGKLQKLAKDKPVLVYCQKGGRSGKAAAKLLEMEFHEVYDLEGGFTAWQASEK